MQVFEILLNPAWGFFAKSCWKKIEICHNFRILRNKKQDCASKIHPSFKPLQLPPLHKCKEKDIINILWFFG